MTASIAVLSKTLFEILPDSLGLYLASLIHMLSFFPGIFFWGEILITQIEDMDCVKNKKWYLPFNPPNFSAVKCRSFRVYAQAYTGDP